MEDHQVLSLLKKIKSDLNSENHHSHSTHFLKTQQEHKRQKASEYQFVSNKSQFKKRRQQEGSKVFEFFCSSSFNLSK